ncbi:MAG: carboxylesterase/lipase family protein [Hyphomonas sp.]
MSLNRRHFLAASATLPLAGKAFAGTGDPVVRTSNGPVRGVLENGVQVFRGVRYGADTAFTRFARPRRPDPWTDIMPAAAYGAAAPQRGGEAVQSEDCLFLNVWTPGSADGGLRPVMVYIHGGAYNSGSGSDAVYDGARLAAKGDVVVITINHRLNAFGYLYLEPVLPGVFPDSGNAGQWDLVLALEWVRRNAAAFGGDAARVMVFGQSGGGAKIASLMASPAAAGLFHSVATMSGQQVTASGPLNAARRTKEFLSALKIDPEKAGEIAALPAARIVEALGARDPLDETQSLYFGPVLDERMLARHPFWPDAPPQSARIPMILGNTLDETRTLIGRREPELFDMGWDALPGALARHMRTDIDPPTVVSAYRAAYPERSPGEIFFAATTAARSWRGQVEEADARARQGAPTWVYRFDLPWAEDGGRWGAPHTVDIGYVFGNLDKAGAMPGEAVSAARVTGELGAAFIALARSGAPQNSRLVDWPQYRIPARETMVIGADTRVLRDPRGAERALFAKVPFVQWGS